ncbi:MAG TPA: transporter substrate-binding domain-containing protein, partial [Acetobacteraceae bacterium]|nr:transporter substrate-binding domain-containing protein [Acetobacteraceae bacterium]
MRAAGVLRACMPPAYPPLVTGDPAAPGIDVDLLRHIANDLGVRLAIVANPAMGRDFNPRAWRITRAQCEVLAGGVVGSATTRSFIDTTQPYAATGWALLSPHAGETVQGRRVGVLVASSGLDRVALSTYLRAAKARVIVTADSDELVQGLADGRFDAGITDRLLAGELAAPHGWTVQWLPEELVRYPVVLGLWKGDLTLKRAISGALSRMQRDGEVAAIMRRYTATGSPDSDGVPDGGGNRRE